MKNILKLNYIEGWKDIGGGLTMYFTLVSGYNRYGCWGLTDDYSKTDRNFKMQAVRDIISEQSTNVFENNVHGNLILFPNPASDYIEIFAGTIDRWQTVDGKPQEDIRIYNILGECVLSVGANVNSPVQRVDVSGLPNGLYYFLINYSDVLSYKKFIIFK